MIGIGVRSSKVCTIYIKALHHNCRGQVSGQQFLFKLYLLGNTFSLEVRGGNNSHALL